MQKINDIFGKEVINQTSGEKIAAVQDVVLDRDLRQIVALLIRGGGLFSDTHVVRWNAVVSMGDVVVVRAEPPLPTLKDDAEVSELSEHANRITGTSVISDKGEELGSIGDIFINERGEVIGYEVKQGMLHSDRYLAVENVQATGKDAIISRVAELPRVKDIHGNSPTAAPSPTASEEDSARHA
ncbi:MAG TPA: PRC-barrel domain-containing protein [Roseiflexaceae bacterium]|jgi:uncharacterized protein YrrD|nr:PRC-barrel domain-containing protein [Roseiflexaceae bacterium]